MKRRIVSVLISIMILSLFSAFCFGADYSFEMSAESDSYKVSKGNSFTVSFYANNITASNGLLSLTADIKYDHAHLKLLSLEGVASDWGTGLETFYVEKEVDGKKVITVNMLYDGDSPEGKGVVNDGKLGIKVKFSVETLDKVSTTVEVLTVGLPDTGSLSGTSGLPELKTVNGLGKACNIGLNGATASVVSEDKTESEESQNSADSSENAVSEESAVESGVDASEESAEASTDASVESASTEENSAVSGEATASENASSVENPSSASDESVESAVESKEESSEGEEKNGPNVILWIVVACVVVAAIAVIAYIVKNKKDDMNPVNPG